MDEVLEKIGVIIIRYLSDNDLESVANVNKKFKELSESALLWRSLLYSFNPRSNKDINKDVRVRTITKRPDTKYKQITSSETIQSKQ